MSDKKPKKPTSTIQRPTSEHIQNGDNRGVVKPGDIPNVIKPNLK